MYKSAIAFKETIEDSLKLMVNGESLSNNFRDNLYNNAMRASQISFQVMGVCSVYVEVSDKFFMPAVTSLGKLIALDPSQDRHIIIQRKLKLTQQCEGAQDAILNIAQQKKIEYDALCQQRLSLMDSTIKSLPRIAPDEQKRIDDVIKEREEIKKALENENVYSQEESADLL